MDHTIKREKDEWVSDDNCINVNKEKWVCDSSVDHKGRLPLRASTGAWKASLFIIAIEFSERLSYFGISASLIIYLTKVIHQDLKTAAKNVNYWAGVTTMMPLLGGFLADSYVGRFPMVLISSSVYLLGLTLLTLSRLVPGLRPCSTSAPCREERAAKIHEVVFFVAIYLISVGTGGHKPSLESFGADQFDDGNPSERKKKMSFFNWWNTGLCSGLLLGVTLIVYVQDHVSWAVSDVILTAVMALTIIIFCSGRPFYRYRVPSGSPLAPMLRVLAAAFAKRSLPSPSDPSHLYEVSHPTKARGRLLCHTQKLKFLDKAAIIEHDTSSVVNNLRNRWRLATVTEVEELKQLLSMIPIWLTTLAFGICLAQASTFFIKQGAMLDLEIARGFLLPPASIYSFAAVGMIVSVVIYDKILEPVLRRATGKERGIKILQRIGVGMVFSITSMVVAALVERRRLELVNEEPEKGSSSMSVMWLVPQFLIIGFGDGFALVGLQEYFYEQVPDSMRSLGIAFYLSVIGAADFLTSLLITVVDHITDRGGKSWFAKDLNSSRLDYFYWLLAALTSLNLFAYVYLAKQYSYKKVQTRKPTTLAVSDCCEDEVLRVLP